MAFFALNKNHTPKLDTFYFIVHGGDAGIVASSAKQTFALKLTLT